MVTRKKLGGGTMVRKAPAEFRPSIISCFLSAALPFASWTVSSRSAQCCSRARARPPPSARPRPYTASTGSKMPRTTRRARSSPPRRRPRRWCCQRASPARARPPRESRRSQRRGSGRRRRGRSRPVARRGPRATCSATFPGAWSPGCGAARKLPKSRRRRRRRRPPATRGTRRCSGS